MIIFPYDIIENPYSPYKVMMGFPFKWFGFYDLYDGKVLLQRIDANPILLLGNIAFYFIIIKIIYYIKNKLKNQKLTKLR